MCHCPFSTAFVSTKCVRIALDRRRLVTYYPTSIKLAHCRIPHARVLQAEVRKNDSKFSDQHWLSASTSVTNSIYYSSVDVINCPRGSWLAFHPCSVKSRSHPHNFHSVWKRHWQTDRQESCTIAKMTAQCALYK